jgi:hypothetical protein
MREINPLREASTTLIGSVIPVASVVKMASRWGWMALADPMLQHDRTGELLQRGFAWHRVAVICGKLPSLLPRGTDGRAVPG